MLPREERELGLTLIAIEDFWIRPFRSLGLFYFVYPSEIGVFVSADEFELP
jgi:hypothetical protein